MGLLYVLGSATQLIISGGISFTSAFPQVNYTTLFFTGIALSGILSTLIFMLLLSIFGSDEEVMTKVTAIYYSIVIFILMITVKIASLFSQTEYSRSHISKIELVQEFEMIEYLDNKPTESPEANTILQQLNKQDYPGKIQNEHLQKSESEKGYEFMKEVFMQTWPCPVLIGIGQLQTALMYPGFSISKITLQGISSSWKTTSLALTFTVFDTLGRVCQPYLPQTEATGKNVINVRYVTCIIFIIMIQNWFPVILRYLIYLNLCVFAFGNGWALTVLMIVSNQKVNDKQRETSSAIIGVLINIGYSIGVILSLLLK